MSCQIFVYSRCFFVKAQHQYYTNNSNKKHYKDVIKNCFFTIESERKKLHTYLAEYGKLHIFK